MMCGGLSGLRAYVRYHLFAYLVLFVVLVLGIERVASVQPAFFWRERAANETCSVYRSLHQHLSSYGSKVFFRSGTILWKDTFAANFGAMLPEAPPVYPAPRAFERGRGTGDAIGGKKDEFTLDTSGYFGQVTVERTLFIRHCFGDGRASFFDGYGWLGIREALFGSYDVRLWDVTPVGFSQDGRYALVYAENFCGFLCGGGSFYLFEQRSGEWTLAGTSLRWIS
jgi:hypothetical protein